MQKTKYLSNRTYAISPNYPDDFVSSDALPFHQSLPGYVPTPLVRLPALAAKLGLKQILVKDESKRFGLNAFKGLGASYAIYCLMKRLVQERFGEPFDVKSFSDPTMMKRLGTQTFSAATDGNHGRAVAWTARMLDQRAVIYIPKHSAPSRIESLRKEGADVRDLDETFDELVNRCNEDSQANGWHTIADIAWSGYEDIPTWIYQGYATIFKEYYSQLEKEENADVVLLQAGVGGLAAAGCDFFVKTYGVDRPKLVCLEPLASDGFLETALTKDGTITATKGKLDSMMAGLNCGIPSTVAWRVIQQSMNAFFAFGDEIVIPHQLRLCKVFEKYFPEWGL